MRRNFSHFCAYRICSIERRTQINERKKNNKRRPRLNVALMMQRLFDCNYGLSYIQVLIKQVQQRYIGIGLKRILQREPKVLTSMVSNPTLNPYFMGCPRGLSWDLYCS